MKKLTLSATLLAVAALALNSLVGAQTRTASMIAAAGPVESVNIVLHDNETSYVVPIGKVLLIENFIWALESGATSQRVSLRPENDPSGVGSFQLVFDSQAPDMFTPERPIRIVGDGASGVHILFNSGGADWRDVLITGTLRDA